jgi:hypothetical protein
MQKYGTYDFIQIDDTDKGWYDNVVACMDLIMKMAAAKAMLIEINQSQNLVEIVPTVKGKGNQCNCVKSSKFVKLRQAFNQTGGYKINDELKATMDRAARAGVTKDFVAQQLARGLSIVTVHTDQNIAPSPGISIDAQSRFKGKKMEGKGGRVEQAKAVIDGYLADSKFYFRDVATELPGGNKIHTHRDDLVRILKPWCEPGAGAASKVFFNPDKLWSCDQDQEGTVRPPAIGLAHELCHAWRNSVGMRFFDDRQMSSLDDDEVMTTGFPPYLNEKFSENLFRSQWKAAELEMRTDYRTYKFEQWQRDQQPK